jgi:hypothetical protein
MTRILYLIEGKYIILYAPNAIEYTEYYELSSYSGEPIDLFLGTLISYLNNINSYTPGTLADKNNVEYTGKMRKEDFEIIYD